ncbi:glycosyltransferase family 2 protein [Ketogulonicigenium vulgare]|uniref:glycosyltransferase family 2 protein n=1 Tax=Ketogulonicigenium vulgare TaxID=92945 RepID=UPI00235A0508|nr:glycosyltransferase family 2 protein [Ketogulonicigenium vulgare]
MGRLQQKIAAADHNIRLDLRRRRLLRRSLKSRGVMRPLYDRTAAIGAGDILAVVVLRNEMQRLPHFLEHHRQRGISHFLCVDNGSDDGSRDYLAAQPDVSLWLTDAAYRNARFGLDWATSLLARYGHGHWCLTLDVDELLIYPYYETRDLYALTHWLRGQGLDRFPAMMLDLYPKGPLGSAAPARNPLDQLQWFDAGNYTIAVQPKMQNLWIQGGVRSRVFFSDAPQKGPTLTKVPLIFWHRDYVYVNSTHSALPARLNWFYNEAGEMPSGVLLHTKFMDTIVAKSAEELQRGQHFARPAQYRDYHAALTQHPTLWSEHSTRLTSWRQLEALGLLSRGGWI